MPVNEYQQRISEEESSRIQRFLYIAAAGTAVFGLLLITFLTLDRWVRLIGGLYFSLMRISAMSAARRGCM